MIAVIKVVQKFGNDPIRFERHHKYKVDGDFSQVSKVQYQKHHQNFFGKVNSTTFLDSILNLKAAILKRIHV